MKKENNNIISRSIIMLAGLLFMGIGIAFTRRSELGISPISSVPNIISYRFTFLSVGTWLMIWNLVLIMCQIIILKKDFKPFQLLQIAVALVFGYFTDFGVWISSFISNSAYLSRLALSICGTVVLGFGISLTLVADVIMNPGEATVKVISDALGKKFSDVKMVFDVSLVLLSVLISLFLFDLRIVGTREGTVISAFCVGLSVKLFMRMLHPISN